MSTAHLTQILLVEDNLADIELTLEALADAKLANEVTVARHGEAALQVLRREGEHAEAARPDLIILDLNLPRLSGTEVLAEIRKDPSLALIPVAILTTSSAEADVLRSYKLGANCYISKPVDVNQFMKVVRSIDDFWLGIVRLPQGGTAVPQV